MAVHTGALKSNTASAHLACEAYVGVGNTADSLDRGQDLIKRSAPLPHEVGNGQGRTPRHALGAVQQDAATIQPRRLSI